jgi:hypothetical protein
VAASGGPYMADEGSPVPFDGTDRSTRTASRSRTAGISATAPVTRGRPRRTRTRTTALIPLCACSPVLRKSGARLTPERR